LTLVSDSLTLARHRQHWQFSQALT